MKDEGRIRRGNSSIFLPPSCWATGVRSTSDAGVRRLIARFGRSSLGSMTTPIQATDPIHRNLLAQHEWSLCVGAGICRNIMPDWASITRQMLGRASLTPFSSTDLQLLVQEFGWSLDSFLQAALNLYLSASRSQDDFDNDMAEELYGDLLRAAAAVGLDEALRRLLSDPFLRDPGQVLALESFLSSNYGSTSILQIGRFLLRAKRNARAPMSVLTFNADVLLHAVLTLLEIGESHSKGLGISPEFSYRGIHRSTDHAGGKIPIFHIHGSITPTTGNREARDHPYFL